MAESAEEKKRRLILLSDLIPGIRLDSFEQRIDLEGNCGRGPRTGTVLDLFTGEGFGRSFAFRLHEHRMYGSEFDLGIEFQEPRMQRPVDQVLIDLGCGENFSGYLIARDCGFKAYVGVDKVRDGCIGEYRRNEAPKIPCIFVREGMLTFLKRLPDESVSLMANGIDQYIIRGEYREDVVNEIKRVLSPRGFYLTDSLIVREGLVHNYAVCMGKADMDYARKLARATGVFVKDVDLEHV